MVVFEEIDGASSIAGNISNPSSSNSSAIVQCASSSELPAEQVAPDLLDYKANNPDVWSDGCPSQIQVILQTFYYHCYNSVIIICSCKISI